MDYLPLFAELKERPVLVIGGGEIAVRKIKFLLRAQAKVQVVAAVLSLNRLNVSKSAGGQPPLMSSRWTMYFW